MPPCTGTVKLHVSVEKPSAAALSAPGVLESGRQQPGSTPGTELGGQSGRAETTTAANRCPAERSRGRQGQPGGTSGLQSCAEKEADGREGRAAEEPQASAHSTRQCSRIKSGGGSQDWEASIKQLKRKMLKPKEKPQKYDQENEDHNQKGEKREIFKIFGTGTSHGDPAKGGGLWGQQVAS